MLHGTTGKLDLGDVAAMALDVAPQPGWSPDPAAWQHTRLQR